MCCLLGSFWQKFKKNPPSEDPVPDEEFQLPKMARKKCLSTEDLQRRQAIEQLKMKYKIHADKEGNFL